jgi:hypothetical protein
LEIEKRRSIRFLRSLPAKARGARRECDAKLAALSVRALTKCSRTMAAASAAVSTPSTDLGAALNNEMHLRVQDCNAVVLVHGMVVSNTPRPPPQVVH